MKLLQFTDFHLRLTPPPEAQFHVQPFWRGGYAELFSRVARAAATADAILFTGDAAHGGGKKEVAIFFDLLAEIAGGKPVFMVVGNHDVVHPDWQEHFHLGVEKYDNFKLYDGVYPLGDIDIALINNEYLTPTGTISPSWRDNCFPVPAISYGLAQKLDMALSASKTRPAIALVHCPTHVPPAILYDFSKGVLAGMDQYQDVLHGLFDKHPRVNLVLAGHVHFNSVRIYETGRVHLSLASIAEYPCEIRMVETDENGFRSSLESVDITSDVEELIRFG